MTVTRNTYRVELCGLVRELALFEVAPGVRIAVFNILGDVISTDSTLAAMRGILHRAGARVVVEAAVFTEGDLRKWPNVICLGHLPVFAETRT